MSITNYVDKSLQVSGTRLIKPFSDTLYPMDGGILILEETTLIRTEMFHHRIKVMTQKNFVLICSGP